MQTALIALAAYLLGSISFAVVVSRLMGLPDPHSYGSKNPGATNVLRTGSKLAAALTLIGDTGKGALAVFLARLLHGREPRQRLRRADCGRDGAARAPVSGVSPLSAAARAWRPRRGCCSRSTRGWAWACWRPSRIIVAFFRMVSLASMISAVFAVFWAWSLFGLAPITPVVGAIALLVIWRHRENIVRIARGVEPRLGEKKT